MTISCSNGNSVCTFTIHRSRNKVTNITSQEPKICNFSEVERKCPTRAGAEKVCTDLVITCKI